MIISDKGPAFVSSRFKELVEKMTSATHYRTMLRGLKLFGRTSSPDGEAGPPETNNRWRPDAIKPFSFWQPLYVEQKTGLT